MIRKAKTGRGYVDKLVKVWLKDGTDVWLLIHIEVQSQVEASFAERMYIYNYRVYDLHRHQVISLAVLADDEPSWRPQGYGYALLGFRLGIEFPTVKLLDYAAQWSALETSRNPFAVVVMAHLKALETRRYPKSRLRWKIEIIKGLYATGWSRADIWELFRFLDWIMELPDHYELQFERALKEFEETQNMRYVTSIERRAEARGLEKGVEQGLEQGIEQGLEQGLKVAREAVLEILALRFAVIPDELTQYINAITTLEHLKTLLRHAALSSSIEEFEHLATAETDRP